MVTLSTCVFRQWSVGFALALAGLGGSLPAVAQAPAADTAVVPTAAPCLQTPLSAARRGAAAALVVEAEVRTSRSFWDAAHRHLFTRHRLRVFGVFKGAVADTAGLSVVTEGGRLGLDQQVLTNTLRLEPGQQGVLFLVPAPWPGLPGTEKSWAAFGSQQGFIDYHWPDGSASEPFRFYPAVDAGFYRAIEAVTGQLRRVLLPNLAAGFPVQARDSQMLTVSDAQPAQLVAGAGAVLTISGAGFGASRGGSFVEFKNADDGGMTWTTARPDDYLGWDDSQILVRVPSVGGGGHPAGSGPVRVTVGGSTALSPAPIGVVYALTNVVNTDNTLLQRPNHIAQNGSGGLDFHFSPSFGANAATAAAWTRALAQWRCTTGMNWAVAAPAPTEAIADDGQNVVAFDPIGGTAPAGTVLPANVLGRTTSYYAGCYAPGGELVFWVKEIDMQFSSAANFQFGPALAVAPQLDFETVAVHELGHAQQLSHLILPGAIMHYAVARGRNARLLTPVSDVAGGRRVLRERSFRRLGCGGPALLPAPLTALAAAYVPGTGPRLSWTTRDECFLTGFVVERSAGTDTSAWHYVGRYASGYADYQLDDPAGRPALTYYRLGLRRPDGSTDYTAPLPVAGDAATAVLFPNPIGSDELHLQYRSNAAATLSLRVYDTVGRLWQTTSGQAQPGLNVLPVAVDELRPGTYFLVYKDETGKQRSLRFVRL